MFVIGLEFNLGKLRAMRTHVFGLGGLQVLLTILPATLGTLVLAQLLPRFIPLSWQSALALSGRSEEHTSELQSQFHLVCRLLLDTATTEIYTLSLHDALPIYVRDRSRVQPRQAAGDAHARVRPRRPAGAADHPAGHPRHPGPGAAAAPLHPPQLAKCAGPVGEIGRAHV